MPPEARTGKYDNDAVVRVVIVCAPNSSKTSGSLPVKSAAATTVNGILAATCPRG